MAPARLAAMLFSDLEPEHVAALAEGASEANAAPGQQVATQGDFGHAIYAVDQGTADVVRHGQKVGTLGPRDVFGEIAVLASGRRTATIVTGSPLKMIAIFK